MLDWGYNRQQGFRQAEEEFKWVLGSTGTGKADSVIQKPAGEILLPHLSRF